MPVKICKDGRVWGQNNKKAGTHLGILVGSIPYDPSLYPSNRKKLLASNRALRLRTKLAALAHYSGRDSPVCAHCGIDDIDVLCLDHINGDGAAYRRIHKNSGKALYFHLKKAGYPAGFQVLCMNCNWKKRIQEGSQNAHS